MLSGREYLNGLCAPLFRGQACYSYLYVLLHALGVQRMRKVAAGEGGRGGRKIGSGADFVTRLLIDGCCRRHAIFSLFFSVQKVSLISRVDGGVCMVGEGGGVL